MIIYIIAIALSMICASYAYNVKNIKTLKSTYHILCIMAFLPMTLVSAFRYDVGTDWLIYDEYFYKIAEGTDRFTEPLFNLLNKVIYIFTEDSWWLFAICAVLIGYFTFRAIMEQSVNPVFSILMLVLNGDYFNSQNQLRQALSMAIFLYAIKYIKSRDWKRYYFFIIVAICIHTSAIIYVPIYFVYKWKVHLKLLICGSGAAIIAMPVLSKLVVFVLSKTKYAWYFDSAYNMNNFYLLGFIFTTAVTVLLVFYWYYGEKHTLQKKESLDETQDYEFNFMFYMYFLGWASILFSAVVPQMSRITTALLIITTLLIPRMVVREHKRNRRMALYLIITSMFLAKLMFDVYHNGWYDAIPYQSVFSR